jgi:small-conductance mechanosensitive channel
MRWLIALGVVVASAIIASIVSGIVRKKLSNSKRPEKIQAIAQPAASILLAIILGLGIVIALGIGDPESLKPLPKNIVAFIPKALTSVLFILFGGAIATLVSNAAATSILKATGRPQPQLARVIRSLITGIFILLGIGQLGLDTKIVDQITMGMIAAIAGAFALIGGLGGKSIATDIAAGRYLKRIIKVGDVVRSDVEDLAQKSGVVTKIHGATIELVLDGESQTIVHVPNALLLSRTIRITRAQNEGTPPAASSETE